MADEKVASEQTVPVVTKVPSPKIPEKQKSAPLALEARFNAMVVALGSDVLSSKAEMHTARLSMVAWYRELSVEERKQIANYGRGVLARYRLVVEALHQEWVSTTQLDVG